MAADEPAEDGRGGKRRLAVAGLLAGGAVVALVVVNRRRRQSGDDLGTRLVELFGQMGDLLSEYQDRVAGEAYLATGRRRGDVHVVFGDGVEGARPPAGAGKLFATYRTGQGACRHPA